MSAEPETGAEYKLILEEHAATEDKLHKALETQKHRQDEILEERKKNRAMVREHEKELSGLGRSVSHPDLSTSGQTHRESNGGDMYEIPCPKCGTRVQTPVPQEPDLPVITQTPDGIKIIGKNGKSINIHINVAGRKEKTWSSSSNPPTSNSSKQKAVGNPQLHGRRQTTPPTILPPLVPPSTGSKRSRSQTSSSSGSNTSDPVRGNSSTHNMVTPAASSTLQQAASTQNTNIPKEDEVEKVCVFCGKSDDSFTTATLEKHYWSDCPMLTKCEDCNQIIEIADLQEHHLTLCEKRTGYKQCQRCKVAIKNSEYSAHTHMLTCPEIRPNSAKQVCPLCRKMVARGEEGWKAHILESTGCSNNPRPNHNDHIG